MARSRGQIRKRGDEKYLIRVYLGRVDGKRKYKSKTVYGDEEYAEKKLTEMLRKKDRGVLTQQSSEGLDSFADDWLESKKGQVAASTYKSYEKYVRIHIKPGLGYMDLEDLGPRLVQEFINNLSSEKDLAGQYVRQIHTCLRMILEKARAWEMIPTNPADASRIDLPSPDSRDYRTLSKEEIRDLLRATKGDRLHALWALMVFTGLRPQEAFGLKWKDLDEDGWLQVRRVIARTGGSAANRHKVSTEMKTESSKRRIKLSPGLMQILERHHTRQAEEKLRAGETYERRDFIFTRGIHPRAKTGRFLYTEHAGRRFKDALRSAGLPADKIRLYDLRHTHITRLIMDGVDLKLASKRAGHSSIQQTADTYAHLGDEAEEQMAKVTEDWLPETG